MYKLPFMHYDLEKFVYSLIVGDILFNSIQTNSDKLCLKV